MIKRLFKSFLSWFRSILGLKGKRATVSLSAPSSHSEESHEHVPPDIPSIITPGGVIEEKKSLAPEVTQSSEGSIELPGEATSQDPSDVEETPAFTPTEQEPSQTVPSESESSTTTQKTTTEEPKKHRRPYKKKAPTEGSSFPAQRRPTDPTSRRKKSTFLGGIRQRRNRTSSTNAPQMRYPGTDEAKQIADAEESFNIQSPFIEISLEEVTVNLILPEQSVKLDTEKLPAPVTYLVELNADSEEISGAARPSDSGNAVVERTEIRLEKPPENLSITYPEVLDERRFDYMQPDSSFYLFRAIGTDLGRMFWLYDESGNPNPLPKRCFWLLLHEGYELEQPSPILIDERWVWDNYKPYLIDLAQTNVLQIRNRTSEGRVTLGAEKSFQIEGERLIEDDFRYESPLFCGRRVSIRAPHTNEQGWTVWIFSKERHARLLRTDWAGEAPIIIECPDHLPAPFGEFQIDVCQTGSRIAEETLFFRWLPSIVIDQKRDLIFPDAQKGHSVTEIRIQVQEFDQWEISNDKNYPVRLTDSNCFFVLPPETDCVRMTIRQRNIPEPAISIKLTVPRVKWRTSNTLAWHSGSSTMKREQLITGAQVNLIVRTNDIFKEYNLTAVLQSGNELLQTERMSKNGLDYIIALNRFFDTIDANSDELCISVEVRDNDDRRPLGIIQTVIFPRKTIERQINSKLPPAEKPVPVRKFHARVICSGITNRSRPGRGFSKKELESAGLTSSAIIRAKQIPFDKRRKSCHQWNVETLLTLE